MFLPSAALSLLLALAGPPSETWQDHEAACGRLEDRAKAASSADRGAAYLAAADQCGRAFEKVPAGHRAIDQRSYFVFEAHRLYQQAHDSGVAAALCSELRMLDAFAGQLATLGPGVRVQDQTDVARLREEVIAQMAAPCVDPDAALMPARDPTVTVTPVSAVTAPPPASVSSESVDPVPASRPARRPLRRTGGAALGVGLGLGVGVIAALVRGADLRGQAASMTYDGQLVSETGAGRFAELDARGHRADNTAIGLSVAGGLLTVAGVALLIVDARRHAAPRRAAVRPSVLPTAGVHFSLRF